MGLPIEKMRCWIPEIAVERLEELTSAFSRRAKLGAFGIGTESLEIRHCHPAGAPVNAGKSGPTKG